MLQSLLIPIGMFILGSMFGFLVGWFGHKYISRKEIENWERALITVIVTFMWAVSLVFDVIVAGYDTPMAVHAVMGLVAGYFFEGTVVDLFKKK